MASPLRHSAACWTTDPINVTGAVAPANGMETISAGTPARANCTMFSEAESDQLSGGEGHTSKTARGLARNLSAPPASAVRRSNMARSVGPLNAPVTIGLFEYQSTIRRR